MGKFLVRITIIGVAIFFIVALFVAQTIGVNIFTNFYVVFFELIAVVYCCSEGKYHCRFLKHTALGIFLADTITRLDYALNFFSVTTHNIVPLCILLVGFTISVTNAIKHFTRVNKIKKQRNEQKRIIANETTGVSSSK